MEQFMRKYAKVGMLVFALMLFAFLPVRADARTINMKKGESARLAQNPDNMTWKSNNADIVTVNRRGLAKAKRLGKTTIIGTRGKKTYTYNIVITNTDMTKYWTDIANEAAGTVIEDSKVNFANEAQYFKVYTINSKVYNRINGKSFNPKGKVKRSDLRYIKVLHYNWDHKIQVGEIIVNKKIATTVCNDFKKMFDYEYEIYSMHLIEKFWKGNGAKSDDYSCEMNNTSGFCYRYMTGSSKKLSNHAYGYAIDINPQQNPYVTKKKGKWVTSHNNAKQYVDRSKKKKGMITHSDYAYKLFHPQNFIWGGDWKSIKDYQHFEYKK